MGIYSDNPHKNLIPPRFPRPTQGIYSKRRPDGSSYAVGSKTCEECYKDAKKQWNKAQGGCSLEAYNCATNALSQINCTCVETWVPGEHMYAYIMNCSIPSQPCGSPAVGYGGFPILSGGWYNSADACYRNLPKMPKDMGKVLNETDLGLWVHACCGWTAGIDDLKPNNQGPPWDTPQAAPEPNCMTKVKQEYVDRIIPQWSDCVNNSADGFVDPPGHQPIPCGKWNPPGLPGGPGGGTTWPPPVPPGWPYY